MSGPSTDYDDGDVDGLVVKMEAAFNTGAYSDGMTITADIEWCGSYNPQQHRTTTLFGLDLQTVRAATAVAAAGRQRAESAAGRRGPAGWGAQFRQLSKTPGGYEAMRAAGVSASIETQQRWLTGRQEPSAGNRAALADATRAVQQDRADRTRSAYLTAAHAAADALSQAVFEVTGDQVRFFNVTDIEFH